MPPGEECHLTDPTDLARRLEKLLRRHGEPEVRVSDVRPISGGYSLLTFGFSATTPVGSRRYVLRLDPPAGASLTHTDRRRRRRLGGLLPADHHLLAGHPGEAPAEPGPQTSRAGGGSRRTGGRQGVSG